MSPNYSTFPLLVKEWSARDELELAEGIMKFGLGNFQDICEQTSLKHKGKTHSECRDHYFALYPIIGSKDHFKRAELESLFIANRPPEKLVPMAFPALQGIYEFSPTNSRQEEAAERPAECQTVKIHVK